MHVLLVSSDRSFRQALDAACRSIDTNVRCVECDDHSGAMFVPALDRVDLVVLDQGLLESQSAAWLSNWRRMRPNGGLLVLDSASDASLARLRQALLRIGAASGPPAGGPA